MVASPHLPRDRNKLNTQTGSQGIREWRAEPFCQAAASRSIFSASQPFSSAHIPNCGVQEQPWGTFADGLNMLSLWPQGHALEESHKGLRAGLGKPRMNALAEVNQGNATSPSLHQHTADEPVGPQTAGMHWATLGQFLPTCADQRGVGQCC